MQVQLRYEDGRIEHVGSVPDAFIAAKHDPKIWKVSWSERRGRRVRFVREGVRDDGQPLWLYEPLMEAAAELMSSYEAAGTPEGRAAIIDELRKLDRDDSDPEVP